MVYPFLKVLMAIEFCMASWTSSAHNSQSTNSTHMRVITELPEEQALVEALVESYYLVPIDSL